MLRWGRWRRKWLDSGPNSWPENQIFSQRAQPGKNAIVVVHRTNYEILLKLVTLLWAWLINNNLTFRENYLLFCNVTSEIRNNGLSVRIALLFAQSPSRVFGKFSHYLYCAQKYWFVTINDSLSLFWIWHKITKNSNGSTNIPFTFVLLSQGLSHSLAGVPLDEI